MLIVAEFFRQSSATIVDRMAIEVTDSNEKAASHLRQAIFKFKIKLKLN